MYTKIINRYFCFQMDDVIQDERKREKKMLNWFNFSLSFHMLMNEWKSSKVNEWLREMFMELEFMKCFSFFVESSWVQWMNGEGKISLNYLFLFLRNCWVRWSKCWAISLYRIRNCYFQFHQIIFLITLVSR